jgi:hypothetical protein
MNNTALETRGRVADAIRGLAVALTDLFALRRSQDALLSESFDDIAWGLSDIAETLTRLERAFNETPRYRSLGASARKAARAVQELEEAWTQVFLDRKFRPDQTRWGPRRSPLSGSTGAAEILRLHPPTSGEQPKTSRETEG